MTGQNHSIMRSPRHPPPTRRQRGATTLFVTLVVLLVMMVLGVTAALLSGTQFKLASNLQFENVAFNLAEGATATAQSWLTTDTNYKDPGFTNGNRNGTGSAGTFVYPQFSDSTKTTPTVMPDPLAAGTWSDDTYSLAIGGDIAKRYMIQKIGDCQARLGEDEAGGTRQSAPVQRGDLFRITARGTSVKGTSKIVQTTYVVPIPAVEAAARCPP
jgi:Tfp pilus assembly protein PilX